MVLLFVLCGVSPLWLMIKVANSFHAHYHTHCSSCVMSVSLWLHDCSPPGSSVHGDSPGKNTGVGCHALLQGIFPTQRLNPGLPCYRWILYWLGCFLDDVLSGRELLTPSGLFRCLSHINSVLTLGCRRRRWHPTPVLLPGKSHWRRSLVGCSPWGR